MSRRISLFHIAQNWIRFISLEYFPNLQPVQWLMFCCFSHQAVENLPVQLRQIDISFVHFKWLLKTFLFGAWDRGIRWPSIPNLSGQSRILRACPEKNTRSFRMLNCSEFQTLSRVSHDLTSRCVKRQAVDQNVVDHFDVFACQRCVLLSSKCTKSIFGWHSAPDPAGGAYDAPPDRLVGCRGWCPLHIPLHSTLSASRSRFLRKCPKFLS